MSLAGLERELIKNEIDKGKKKKKRKEIAMEKKENGYSPILSPEMRRVLQIWKKHRELLNSSGEHSAGMYGVVCSA